MPQPDDNRLTVIVNDAIADAIDSSISGPVDAIIAIEQVIHELPDIHRQRRSRRRLRFGAGLPVYRGIVDWCGVGFEYVEHRGYLHILGVRDDIAAEAADAVIEQPIDSAQCVHETACGNGVSLIS